MQLSERSEEGRKVILAKVRTHRVERRFWTFPVTPPAFQAKDSINLTHRTFAKQNFLEMDGEKDLEKLLAGCSPVLSASEFVFVSFPSSRYGDHSELSPIAFIVEDEGATLVVPRSEADARQIGYESVFKRITLNIHSSLDAVGLTAAVSTALSDHGISANVIAGFFHDHIFVRHLLLARHSWLLRTFCRRPCPLPL